MPSGSSPYPGSWSPHLSSRRSGWQARLLREAGDVPRPFVAACACMSLGTADAHSKEDPAFSSNTAILWVSVQLPVVIPLLSLEKVARLT